MEVKEKEDRKMANVGFSLVMAILAKHCRDCRHYITPWHGSACTESSGYIIYPTYFQIWFPTITSKMSNHTAAIFPRPQRVFGGEIWPGAIWFWFGSVFEQQSILESLRKCVCCCMIQHICKRCRIVNTFSMLHICIKRSKKWRYA